MKSRLLMLISLIVLGVGIVGAVLTRTEPPNQVAEVIIDEPDEPTILLWTTKAPLEQGQVIERTDLQITKVPESQALSYGVKEDLEIRFVKNMVVNRDIPEGDPIFSEDLVLPSQAGYFKLIMEPGYVPYPISVDESSVVGGVVESGSYVDVLVLGSKSQNLSNGASVRNIGDITLTPLLLHVKVLQVIRSNPEQGETAKSAPKAFGGEGNISSDVGLTSLVLQLDRKQISTLTIAKRITQLEVHLSSGDSSSVDLKADAGDVVTEFKAVKEYRPGTENGGVTE